MLRHVAFMNGWADAPHCWPHYVCKPPRLERYGPAVARVNELRTEVCRTWCFSWMGFVWFFDVVKRI